MSKLESNPLVQHLMLLEAPLIRAADDNRIGADALELINNFRIQFQLIRRVPNDT